MRDVQGHLSFPADGFSAAWSTGDHTEQLTLSWDNEAWTAVGRVGSVNVEYVMRITAQWRLSQFLLFRDLDEADLWLGTDGRGRWGEVNGAHRPDLDGASDIALGVTPFTHTVPIRRLPLEIGDSIEVPVLRVDVERLGVVPVTVSYERRGERDWVHRSGDDETAFSVDEYGLPTDVAGFVRTA